MHRHGYKGRKFGRERDQRKALLAGLAESLIVRGAITTTRPKAKELVPYAERLITRAKSGSLADRRQVLRDISTSVTHKLFDEIAPKLKARDSGHLSLKVTGSRRGDNAQLATISFVDKIGDEHKPTSPAPDSSAKKAGPKVETDKPDGEAHSDGHKHETATDIKPKAVDGPKLAPRRTGVRGNR